MRFIRCFLAAFLVIYSWVGIAQSDPGFFKLFSNKVYNQDYGVEILPENDSILVLVQETEHPSSFIKLYVLALDSSGNSLRKSTLNRGTRAVPRSMSKLSTNHIAIGVDLYDTLENGNDVAIFKYDALLSSFDSLTVLPFIDGRAEKVKKVCSDYPYVLVGGNVNSSSNSKSIVFLAKYDSEQDTVHITEYDFGENCYLRDLIVDNHGHYIAVSEFDSPSYDDCFHIMKINSNGNLIWDKIIERSYRQILPSITELSNGNFLLTGIESQGSGIEYSGLFVEINNSGDTLKTKTTNFFPAMDEGFLFSAELKNGDIISCGDVDDPNRDANDILPNILVARLTSNFDTLWTRQYSYFDTWSHNYVEDMAIDAKGNILLTGYVITSDSLRNEAFVLKLDSNGRLESPSGFYEVKSEQASVNVFPNPTKGKFKINVPQDYRGLVEIIDVSGKLCFSEAYSKPEVDIQLPKGSYLLRLRSIDQRIWHSKFVVE